MLGLSTPQTVAALPGLLSSLRLCGSSRPPKVGEVEAKGIVVGVGRLIEDALDVVPPGVSDTLPSL